MRPWRIRSPRCSRSARWRRRRCPMAPMCSTSRPALARWRSQRRARVLAIDFSPGMVRHVLSYGLPNLEARQMDGQALDLLDASFDAAFSNFGVMPFPDWRAGLAENCAGGASRRFGLGGNLERSRRRRRQPAAGQSVRAPFPRAGFGDLFDFWELPPGLALGVSWIQIPLSSTPSSCEKGSRERLEFI